MMALNRLLGSWGQGKISLACTNCGYQSIDPALGDGAFSSALMARGPCKYSCSLYTISSNCRLIWTSPKPTRVLCKSLLTLREWYCFQSAGDTVLMPCCFVIQCKAQSCARSFPYTGAVTELPDFSINIASCCCPPPKQFLLERLPPQ